MKHEKAASTRVKYGAAIASLAAAAVGCGSSTASGKASTSTAPSSAASGVGGGLDRRSRYLGPLVLLALTVTAAGCSSGKTTITPSATATTSGAAPTTATAAPTTTGAAAATAALPHPCSLVTQQEAIAISGMQQATVSDDSKFECVYDGTTAAGAAARVAVQLKALSSPAVFTQDAQQSQCAGTSNTTTAVPGVGDEAVQHADCLFVRKGSIEMNLYIVPAPADPNAQAQLARTAVSRF